MYRGYRDDEAYICGTSARKRHEDFEEGMVELYDSDLVDSISDEELRRNFHYMPYLYSEMRESLETGTVHGVYDHQVTSRDRVFFMMMLLIVLVAFIAVAMFTVI